MRIQDWQIRIIQLLSVPGISLAFYLWLYHNGDLVAACGTTQWSDCGAVSGPDAPYSAIGPIPVALIGVVGYGLIFLLTWLRDWWDIIDGYLPELLVGVTGLAFLLTLGLTALELFVIHAFCNLCVVSAIIITIMFGLSISHLRTLQLDAPEASVFH